MSKHEKTEKQPKRRSRIGIVLLVIFLILLGAVGFLYYSVSLAPLELDDPMQLSTEAPIPAQERFRFVAADETVQIKVGAADVWNYVVSNTGADFLDIVNQELSAYSLSVSGCGIQIDESGLQLNLELYYQNIRLIASVPCALEVSGQKFSFKPSAVKLGMLPLPVEDILSDLNLEFEQQLPVISDMTGIIYEQDAIWICGTMKEDVRALIPADGSLYRVAAFSKQLPLAAMLETDAGYAAVMSHLEQNPGDIEIIYHDLFAMSGPEITDEYLAGSLGLMRRVLPNIDYTVLEAEREKMLEEIEPHFAIMNRFFANVLGDYNGKVFQFSDGEFLKKLKPFHATNYGTGNYDALFEIMDTDSFFLVLVDAEDGFTKKTPALNQLADENQQFTQPVEFDKTYIMGCVFRGFSGDPFLMYENEIQGSRNLMVCALSEDDVNQLKTPGKFGVWTN